MPVRSKKVLADAKKAGHTDYAFRRACSKLGIKRKKIGNDVNAYWAMYLPEDAEDEQHREDKKGTGRRKRRKGRTTKSKSTKR